MLAVLTCDLDSRKALKQPGGRGYIDSAEQHMVDWMPPAIAKNIAGLNGFYLVLRMRMW
jgi:hypothetical protein